jgi:hypothetical protein
MFLEYFPCMFAQVNYRRLEALKEGDSDDAVEEAVVAGILLDIGADRAEGFSAL